MEKSKKNIFIEKDKKHIEEPFSLEEKQRVVALTFFLLEQCVVSQWTTPEEIVEKLNAIIEKNDNKQ